MIIIFIVGEYIFHSQWLLRMKKKCILVVIVPVVHINNNIMIIIIMTMFIIVIMVVNICFIYSGNLEWKGSAFWWW